MYSLSAKLRRNFHEFKAIFYIGTWSSFRCDYFFEVTYHDFFANLLQDGVPLTLKFSLPFLTVAKALAVELFTPLNASLRFGSPYILRVTSLDTVYPSNPQHPHHQ